jgi:sugar transferase (PEP-CTERM/EpsH1 system associated)
MTTMNVLYLVHRLPYPPNKGDKLRSFHELSYLRRRHQVWCGCFVDDPADLLHVDAVRAMCADAAAIRLFKAVSTPRGLWNLARGGTFTEGYYQHLQMVRTLHRWNSQVAFDAVLVFSSGMAPYAQCVNAPRKVLDFCDLDSRKWTAYARRASGARARLYDIEGRRLATRELQWLNEFDAAAVITDAEAADLGVSALRQRVFTISNGVTIPELPESQWIPPTPVAGFVGCMDYPPNIDAVVWFVREIWPLIRRRVPDASFEIVGRHPTRAVRALADAPGVHVVGEVDDVFSFVRRFRVSVSPIRIARGLQNKVLEAMAAARPVVLTSAAATGLSAKDGVHYLIADAASAFAEQVVSLLADPDRCFRLGAAARRFVAANHCWEREMSRLESLLFAPAPSSTSG